MKKNSSQQTSKLQQWLENTWYNNGVGSEIGKYLLLPLTALYCSVNSFQRFQNSDSKTKLPYPVIVVGNITVGGTGKTPLTIHVVKLLQKAGYKPAIITRGYGGEADTWPQSVTENLDPKMVGDEAVLMASRTQVPVYAGANRLESIEAISQNAQEYACDVIVSDDGMQHYKLPRDIQIAVLDGTRMLGNGWCLPSGPLREKKKRLDACDLIVVNGEVEERRADDLQGLPFFTMDLKGTLLTNLVTHEQKSLADFLNEKVHAVTGIGNPQRFFTALQKQSGLRVTTHSFPDHHSFSERDFDFGDDLPILMTEKDAVKCFKFAKNNFWTLPITAELDEGFEKALLSLLNGVN